MRARMPAASLALALLACACLHLGGAPLEQDAWALDARRPAEPARSAFAPDEPAPVLVVRPFRAASGLEGRGFLVRTEAGRWERDFYHEHAVPPAARIGDLAQQWLAASGLFGAVLAPGVPTDPELSLDGRLLALHLERDASASTCAVLELECVLVDARSGALVALVRCAEREPVLSEGPAEAVRAWDAALARCLARLESELAAALRERAARARGGDEARAQAPAGER